MAPSGTDAGGGRTPAARGLSVASLLWRRAAAAAPSRRRTEHYRDRTGGTGEWLRLGSYPWAGRVHRIILDHAPLKFA